MTRGAKCSTAGSSTSRPARPIRSTRGRTPARSTPTRCRRCRARCSSSTGGEAGWRDTYERYTMRPDEFDRSRCRDPRLLRRLPVPEHVAHADLRRAHAGHEPRARRRPVLRGDARASRAYVARAERRGRRADGGAPGMGRRAPRRRRPARAARRAGRRSRASSPRGPTFGRSSDVDLVAHLRALCPAVTGRCSTATSRCRRRRASASPSPRRCAPRWDGPRRR